MKTVIIITNYLVILTIGNASYRQDKPVRFSYAYPTKNDTDRIQLKIENTGNSTIYYSIGIGALTDTGWVFLLGNLDALGKNEWFMLKALSSNTIARKMVSKKDIFETYFFVKSKKIRFSLAYNTRRSLDGKEKIFEIYP